MEAGEVVIALCERVQEVTEWLAGQGAEPVTSFRPLAGAEAGTPRSAA
jgi:hypothetical protein